MMWSKAWFWKSMSWSLNRQNFRNCIKKKTELMLRLPERRTNYLKTCVNYKIDNIKIPDSSFDWKKTRHTFTIMLKFMRISRRLHIWMMIFHWLISFNTGQNSSQSFSSKFPYLRWKLRNIATKFADGKLTTNFLECRLFLNR